MSLVLVILLNPSCLKNQSNDEVKGDKETNQIKGEFNAYRKEQNQQFQDVQDLVINNADPAWMRISGKVIDAGVVLVLGIYLMKLRKRKKCEP